MLSFGIAWLAGFRNALVTAVGIAAFGFAFLWPQYKSERGVWMGGILILLIASLPATIGVAGILRADGVDTSIPSEYWKAGEILAVIVLTLFSAFAIYASIKNYCLPRSAEAKTNLTRTPNA